MKLLHTLWRFLHSPRLLFYVLIYFMGVLVVGTVAQKEMGLFSATHLFFNSFFYWIGPVPVPVGASVLLVLFINMTAHFVTTSKWDKPYIGSTIAHFSILLLLFGGGVTLLTKQEGFMLLRQNDSTPMVYDYHRRDIVVYRNTKEIARIRANGLHANTVLALPSTLPVTITLQERCENCHLDEQGALAPLTANKEDEVNQWGMRFSVQGKKDTHAKDITVTEFSAPHEFMTQGDIPYRIALRRYSWPLPFSLELIQFSQSYHPGTGIAQHYESALYVREPAQDGKAARSWPARISMNDPLRYNGYTFYQSSVLSLPNNEVASVLNVVKNAGWLFPYIATFLLCAGLLVHLGVRRHAPH